MPSVNLAPGTQYAIAARKRRIRLFVVAVIVLIVVAIAWVGLFLYESQLKTQVRGVQEQLSNVQAELASLSDGAKRVEQFEKQINALAAVLKDHIEWEPVLQNVEKLMPPATRLSSLEANAETGELFLSGHTPDIDQLSQAIASLKSDASPFMLGKLSGVTRVEIPQEEGTPPVIDYVFDAEFSFAKSLVKP